MPQWVNKERPGFFGRRKYDIIARLNETYGRDGWRLVWIAELNHVGTGNRWYTYDEACRFFYEESYYRYLQGNPSEVDFICQYQECYDNALSNVQSGLDYRVQEAYSTHIQDIAVRNALRRLGRSFTGANGRMLQIRGASTDGHRFGPGNIPFYRPELIIQPSLKPAWAGAGSVEDFWQSNKTVQA